MIRLFALVVFGVGAVEAAPLVLSLPTENRGLLSGEPEKFYMYVDRTFEGKVSKPWEGGAFGLVRSPIRVNGELVFTHFHEGIDIAPLKRDRAGNPLDPVASIADGTVVHTSPLAGRSNYGKYVVVEHRWEGSAVYSLYAHLAEITCQPGELVKAGGVLGRMGFTGVGLNRTRAHLHLELALLMSARYEDWHQLNGGGTNVHGLFNGMNLAGTEVARFFVEHQMNPELQFSHFVAATPVYFKVCVPAHGQPDLVTRYPWLLHGEAEGAASWEISFSATGLPVALTASQRQVLAPTITEIRPSLVPQRYQTRNLVTGDGSTLALTQGGRKLVALLMDDFPVVPAPAEAGKKKAKNGA
ncbi:MAG: M23 family metallopeptidase [Verrucomicrobia bacterium]|nr:M23 family metallopeptidase [Verrucomicrobiota bacterium]